MARESVLFLQAVFFFIELAIYKCICNTQISDCFQMVKNETTKITYFHGTRNVEYLFHLLFLNSSVNVNFNIITKYNRKWYSGSLVLRFLLSSQVTFV